MNRKLIERTNNAFERFAIRLGVRTLDFSTFWIVASTAGPYINAWGEARGLSAFPSIPKHDFVSFLATTTALYECALRQRFANMPTMFSTGLHPRQFRDKSHRDDLETVQTRAFDREDVTLPWPEK